MPNPFVLFIAPTTTLTRLKSKPDWLVTFVLLSAISIAVYILIHPFLVSATLAHLPSSATQEEKNVMAQTLQSELPLRCLFIPIRLLIGWSSFAAVLFLVCKSFAPPEPVHFNKIFSLEVHAELINICAQIATAIHLFIAPNSSAKMTGLIPFSAAMFINSNDIVSFSLLNSLNIFTLFYITIQVMGISNQSGFLRLKSLLIVLIVWSAYLLFNIGSIKLMRDTMHLLV